MSADDQGNGTCGYVWLATVVGGILGASVVLVPVARAVWGQLHP